MKKDFSTWCGSLLAAFACVGFGVAAAWAEPFVVGWGMNADGQAVPVPVEALSGATAIAAGYHHSLAVVDSCTYAWGFDDQGQCTVPTAGRTNVVAVAAGEGFSAAVRTDGSLAAWGRSDVAAKLVGDYATGVAKISAGENHILVLKKDGRVLATGVNSYAPECTVPTNGLSGVVQVAAGARFSLALKSDGTIVGWGTETEDGGVLSSIPASLQGHAKAIAAGHYHALAVTDAGAVVAWGSFADNYPLPDGAKSGVTAIAAGYEFSLALKSDGTVLAWGDDEGGRLDLPASLAAGASQIAAGYGHGLALSAVLAPYWLEQNVPGDAYVARPYSGGVTATGMPAVTYHKSGNWPSWLKLDAGTGALSGTPAKTAAVVRISVVASNRYGTATSEIFPILVSDTPLDPPGFITMSVDNGEIGLPYSFRILASNSPVFYASRTDSYPLPAGLTLAGDGTLSGMPAEAYDSIFYVTASNATAAVEQEFRMTVTGPSAAPEILTGSPLPAAVSGTGYSVQFETDREAAFAISAGALPDGLALEPATGVLSGTPAASGPFAFTLQAANSFGVTTAEFELAVNAAPAITTATLPGGSLGKAYSQSIAATGWPVPTFAVASGSLPAGLVLGADGVISGTPTADGTFTFGAIASNTAGNDTRNFSITIDSTPPVVAPQFTSMTFIASNKTVVLEWTTPVTTNTYLYWSTNISSATPTWKSLGRKKSGAKVAQTNNTPIYYRLRIP